MSSLPSGFLTLALGVAISFLLYKLKPKSSQGSLPPGPKQSWIPLVGNLHQLPKSRPWVKMEEWTREFGPIYTIRLGLQNVVVLGRAGVATELLDKRSAKYSSRARLIMTSDLVSRGLRMTFMEYSDLWRSERRLLHQLTSPRAAASYEDIQSLESAALLRDMLRAPKNFWGHCQRYAGSTIMQIAFNKRAPTPQDPAITDMRNINNKMTKTAVPGTYLVDSLPFLNYLPSVCAPWKREASVLFDETLKLFTSHFDDVRADIKTGADVHCFARYILEAQKSYNLTDNEAVFLGGAMYGAGSDTTADAISTFILTMVAHPDVLDKAHEELDRVIGRDRLPEFSDQDDLVYVRAVIQEIMRWRTVIAGGLAHCTTEDDVYEGYFIPKGTTVLANHWAIHLDPEIYPDPTSFKPERFIKNGKLIGIPGNDRGHFGYGFGRRICPGMHIADRSLFIVFTRCMWALNIRNAVDANGVKIPVDVNAYSPGFSSHPLAFQCDITSRGDWVNEAVEAATAGVK